MRTDNLYSLPEDLPVPQDDGACDHLRGAALPTVSLHGTSGQTIKLSEEGQPWLIVYCYPRTGHPDKEPPGGAAAWNAIPGARGCTPQACAFRNHHSELATLGATVYGLSTQESEYQAEAVQRLHLPFQLLSDSSLEFTKALRLPTFTFGGLELIRRLTLIARAGVIEQVFYPVFPPDADAKRVMQWLILHSDGRTGVHC